MSLDFLKKTTPFQSLLQAMAQREKGLKITGLIPPAKAYFLTTLAMESKKKMVLIRPSSSPLIPFEQECRFFLSQYSSNIRINSLPPLSENPYHEVFPSLDAISTRMRFFYNLCHHPPSLIFTNLFGLLRPFPKLRDSDRFFLELEREQEFKRDILLKIMAQYGYTREDLVNSAGEYAWRGGIVDIFSPWEPYPFRVEFSGDEISSLRQFDPSTQRSIKKMESITVPSLTEFLSSSQHVREWEERVREKADTSTWGDLQEKIERVKGGDFFPAFFSLSLLHEKLFAPFTEYLKDYLFIIDGADEVEREWRENIKDLKEQYLELKQEKKFNLSPEQIYPPHLWDRIKKNALFFKELAPSRENKSFSFSFQSVPKFKNKIPFFIRYLKRLQDKGERCFIYISSQGVRQKLGTILSQHKISFYESSSPFAPPQKEGAVLLVGDLRSGFSYPKKRINYFSESDIFTEERVLISRPRVKPFLSHFQDLKTGDYVVHTDYGIGIFKGLMKLRVDGNIHEFITIIYRDDDKLYVPVEDLNLVQKFSKAGTGSPTLNKLGSPTWERTKARTKRAIQNMAKELLHLYAQRKAGKGFRYSPEGEWEEEFDRMFEYQETQDQLRAAKEIRKDMECLSPMDRLLCGDVGYGKTEVAMRASFKAVMDGKQVAVLCPTTVLANQHLNTFRSRMVLFPVRIEALSRLQTKAKQKKIVQDLRKGYVDAIIGTHRLLSEDVEFHDLGLLIVDEEQRFGVNHKEKIKKMKTNIDVLAMSATPIPRTLNLSLTGIRDISLIETPPQDRLAIHTVVAPFSLKLISSAIKMELARRGQVYYVHNRIDDIQRVASVIEKHVPEAEVAVIHGQMSSASLERMMIDFIDQKYNVLVSTTIIENGIDIPLVNTLIVDRADRFGLAQLYQLRGRVGRSSRQAVAYFLVPPFTELTPLARERLKALQEFSELGSGFRLAAKDLEIRGAGNFLGAKQHGYMEAVGFDYYMHLLEQSIKELKGEKKEEIKSKINLRVDIRIPEDYLPQINLRLNLYKRISSVEDLNDIQRIREEMKDRFGPFPSSVENLFGYGIIKYLAQSLKIKSIDRIGKKVIFKFYPSSSVDLARLTSLMEKHSGTITPQGVMSLSLSGEGEKEIMDETLIILKELSLM